MPNHWIIDRVKPSITASGNSSCNGLAHSPSDISGSLSPPESARWIVGNCKGGNDGPTGMPLSLQPMCSAAPNFTYTYPDEWTDIKTECRQRTEVEACHASHGCPCAHRRKPETETREHQLTYGYSWTEWSDAAAGCGPGYEERVESCSAARKCGCDPKSRLVTSR